MRALTFLARRFVAGDSLDDAMEVVRALNAEGLKVTLDHLGEECKSPAQAEADCREYLEILRRIGEARADANVSLKLTQFGLNLDRKLAKDNLIRVLEEARKRGIFVRLDMEGSGYTQKTLDLFYELFPVYPNVGVVIQAMLRRSPDDVAELARRGARVRLCKGAYKEPAAIAFESKEDVNAQYDKLAEMLCQAPIPAFATHDDARIERACAAAQAAGLKPKDFELQMLYGLRAKRWRELRDQGHAVRIYVPYGTHWFPYFYRRLRERKENVFFVLKNLVGS
jgi:proline dehydrogenase